MRRDLTCAVLGVALACAYYAAAAALPRSLLADDVGADGVPKLLAMLLALLSIAIGVRGAVRGAGDGGIALRRHARAFGVAALGAAYLAAVPLLGFAPALALLLLAAMLYYGAALRPPALLYALVGAAILWLIFAQGLGLAVPAGVFG